MNSRQHRNKRSGKSVVIVQEPNRQTHSGQTNGIMQTQHIPAEVPTIIGVSAVPICSQGFANSKGFTCQKDIWKSALGVLETQEQKEERRRKSIKAMDTVFFNEYESKVRPCIDLIDQLRAFGVDKDLGLPAIAVIGDQSSGKSSVLEALSGVSLPRGKGIVTRCPLELKLKKVRKENVWKGKIKYKDYVQILKSTTEVEQEIHKAQNTIAGQGVGISPELISLEIESSNVPDLTLIDLPGIARVAVGDQPVNIGDQIKKLIKSFIQKQETINLVVVPCNVDIATTEALKMAQEVDPSGERTLGILTKPDLVDKGTEASVVDIMRNIIVELKKGYMIVKCRGQKDIDDKLTLDDAITKERMFFEDHEHFRQLLDNGVATIPCLAGRLTNELVSHINKSLPQLRKDVEMKLNKTKQSLKDYSNGVPDAPEEKLMFMIEKINKFCHQIKNLTSGEETQILINGMRYITKVRKVFEEWNSFLEKQSLNFRDDLRNEIRDFENNYRGRELPGFVNYKTFESLVRDNIVELKEPAINKLKVVTELTRTASIEIAEEHFKAFSNLFKFAKIKIESISHQQESEAEKMLKAQFKIENMVYSQDKIYSSNLSTTKNTATIFANATVQEMSHHVQTYYKIASCRLADQIPLVICYHILHEFADKLQAEMLTILQDRDRINEYLFEDQDTKRKRETLQNQMSRLIKAHKALFEFA
ncbi:interferon-induced GTP-binding protein Mx3-like isoform X1 [Hemiscyllium ocellatum]|uniref:interferon-induced GTP-binding protein Mx3-like isoform X1 n=2 Tax=Hemiscyllium ocellatum TaxID=170820 RepID=UPI0029666199|nr:interferon-induced GTP-binding protein Mx3-like isoform X1 [Hemiscyllium ocellatum]